MFGMFRKPVTVIREAAGSYVDGFWVPGGTSTLIIKASVQPATDDDISLLPEGKRLSGAYKLFTDDALTVAVEGQTQQADRVTIGGDLYEISARAVWDNAVLPHNEYIATRVQS